MLPVVHIKGRPQKQCMIKKIKDILGEDFAKLISLGKLRVISVYCIAKLSILER